MQQVSALHFAVFFPGREPLHSVSPWPSMVPVRMPEMAKPTGVWGPPFSGTRSPISSVESSGESCRVDRRVLSWERVLVIPGQAMAVVMM